MMLGREVSTPLDLMYEMPQATKFVPHNKWAWKLKETLEDAHRFVRENIDTAMMRQKRYHDQKLSWQQFKPDDNVYVYFPLRKVGRSPKFTSYWQGPFKIIDKVTDLTYRVNCGPRGKPQVVHVDRLRHKREQVLRGEIVDNEVQADSDQTDQLMSADGILSSDEAEIQHADNHELLTDTNTCVGSTRIRRPPTWLNDFVRW
jgi:hypothetical protein